MHTGVKLFVLAASAISLIGMSSLSASARIICNEDGDCWHAPDAYAYPPSVHLDVHQTAGAGKKASAALGKSTRVAATGTAANGRVSEPKPDLLMNAGGRESSSRPLLSVTASNDRVGALL